MQRELIAAIEKLERAFKENDLLTLKRTSNESIEKAALKSDRLLAEVSLIAYSLSKLSSKEHIVKNAKWPAAKKTILVSLSRAISSLKESRLQEFERNLRKISENVTRTDEKLGHYVLNIYNKAKLKQASRAYAFGLSLSSAADLTGADKKHLLEYIGATKIHEEERSPMKIRERLKHLIGKRE